MFRFLKRNDSEVITPEVVDVPVMTIQSNIAMALALCMESTLLVGSKQFDDVCKKYKLVKGLLKQYTGVFEEYKRINNLML